MWGEGNYINEIFVVVTYVVYTNIESGKKFIVSKNNNLARHQGKQTCIAFSYLARHLWIGNTYTIYKICTHLKNCKEWAHCKLGLVVDQVQAGLIGDSNRKDVQFVTLYILQ